jgi:hypothetical protein
MMRSCRFTWASPSELLPGAAFTLKLRFQVAALGALVIFLGMFRLSHGVSSVINVYAMRFRRGGFLLAACYYYLP